MKKRVILFSVLVVALALAACVPAEAPAQPQGEAVSGAEVAAGETRLFSDAQKTNLAYSIQGQRVYQGAVSQNQVILFFNGTTVFRGANESGEKLFTVKDGAIYEGAQASGAPVWTIADGRIHEGTANGPTVYTLEGERLFQGPQANPSKIVFASNADLTTGDVQFVLPILATQRY